MLKPRHGSDSRRGLLSRARGAEEKLGSPADSGANGVDWTQAPDDAYPRKTRVAKIKASVKGLTLDGLPVMLHDTPIQKVLRRDTT